jgi:hypothetical protein
MRVIGGPQTPIPLKVLSSMVDNKHRDRQEAGSATPTGMLAMYYENSYDSPPLEPSNVRKGRFLWMTEDEQSAYLTTLRGKIADGYFFTDRVLSEVVSEIAPILREVADQEEVGEPGVPWRTALVVGSATVLLQVADLLNWIPC